MKSKSYSFKSARGNRVDVYNERAVVRVGVWSGRAASVASYAVVCGVRVEVEAGCAYQAPSRVHAAGF